MLKFLTIGLLALPFLAGSANACQQGNCGLHIKGASYRDAQIGKSPADWGVGSRSWVDTIHCREAARYGHTYFVGDGPHPRVTICQCNLPYAKER